MDLQKSETAYRVLARKYRPQNFADLIGQEPMVRTLTNAFDMGRIAQAWMLTGVRGVGKTTTARILARALNYKTAAVNAPSVHLEEIGEHCQAIMEGRHVDVVEMDAASHTGIDDIREIIEQIRYRPVAARYKVYIIDEVHMLSAQAFNGLLKTLEEPPPHAKFIFATTEIRKVPITVLSRCQRFDLRRIDAAALTRHLQNIAEKEGISAETEALAMIARAGEGSVRDCLSMLDQAIAHSGAGASAGKVSAEAVRAQLGLADKTQIIDLFRFIMRGKVAQALAQMQRLYEYGADSAMIIRELLDFNHFVTRLKFQPDLAEDVSLSEEERKAGAACAEKLSVRVLSRSWQMLLKGLSETENAARPQAAAEMLLIRLCHAADLPNLDDALRALGQSQGRAPKPQAEEPAGKAEPAAQNRQQTTAAGAAEAKMTAAPAAPMAETARKQAAEAEPAPTAPAAGEKAAKAAGEEAAAQQQQQAAPAETLPAKTLPNERQSSKKKSDFGLKQLAAMAEARGKLQLHFYLREAVRPVLLQAPAETAGGRQAGLIRFVPTEAAPADIERQISALLMEETGERWQVEAVAAGGGASLSEEERQQKQALMDNAEKSPEALAVLSVFPQAKLVDVRLEHDDEILPEADAAAGCFDEPLSEDSGADAEEPN